MPTLRSAQFFLLILACSMFVNYSSLCHGLSDEIDPDSLPGPSIIPRMLYDPSNGQIAFEKLDGFFNFIGGVNLNLRLLATHENLLPLESIEPSLPSNSGVSIGATYTAINWFYNFDLSDSLVQPIYAGKIVVPGTNIEELTFIYLSSAYGTRTGQIVQIPEPATGFLILAGLFLVIGRRWRQKKSCRFTR